MSYLLETKDIELKLDLSGRIRDIVRCQPDLLLLEKGTSLVRYIEDGCHQRFYDYLVACNTRGFLVGGELVLKTNQGPVSLSVLFIKKEDDIIFVNLNESTQMLRIMEDIMKINNELIMQIRKSYQRDPTKLVEPQSLEEISKLNSELINVQRTLTQKNRELERLNQTLEELSLLDDLTYVGNRRKFFKDIQAKINDVPSQLYMIDLNYFKRVNDDKGHKTGDTLLREFALRVKKLIQPFQGEMYRLGGDEFWLLVPETSSFQLSEHCADLNQFLQTFHPLVSIAFGVMSLSREMLDEQPIEKIMALVDQKMYDQKNQIKNK